MEHNASQETSVGWAHFLVPSVRKTVGLVKFLVAIWEGAFLQSGNPKAICSLALVLYYWNHTRVHMWEEEGTEVRAALWHTWLKGGGGRLRDGVSSPSQIPFQKVKFNFDIKVWVFGSHPHYMFSNSTYFPPFPIFPLAFKLHKHIFYCTMCVHTVFR